MFAPTTTKGILIATLHGPPPAVWCFAGATSHEARGRVVLRDGRAARPRTWADRITQQALVSLRPHDLIVTLGGEADADWPIVILVDKVSATSIEQRSADIERVSVSTVEAWLMSSEGRRFWAACRVHHNRTWPL